MTLETLPGATPVATQTTGADGSYLFTGLAAGMYRLVETPPGTDTNAGTSVFTQLDQVTATTSSSIDVTIGDPGTTPPWTVDTVSSNKDGFSFTASSPHVNQLRITIPPSARWTSRSMKPISDSQRLSSRRFAST